jgi:hypothetical protein
MSTTVKVTSQKNSSEPRYKNKSPTRGGARAGAGRKKGSSPRYTLEDLMLQVEHHTGRTFAEQVAINYANAIGRDDHAGVRDYDKILLGKMVADRQEVVTVESEDAVEIKKAAFAEAIAAITGKK